jgi:hypothetical protein
VETIVKGEESKEQLSDYFDELRIIADKMEVFPIDFIARQGSFSNIRYGRPKIGIRLELTNRNFRYFYDFCELALRATEEDIEVCIEKIKSASPQEQSLILTVIYVYSFPWSKEKPFVYSGDQEELKKYWDFRNSGGEDIDFNVLLGYRSWLGMNYHNFDTQNRPICEEVIRSKYKNIVEKFINDPQVAFPAITFSPQEEIENRNYEHYERYKKITENIDDKLKRIRGELLYNGLTNISLRKEKLDLLKENYPEEYQQIISDIFFLLYIADSSPSYPSGIGTKKGNTSTTPKTVGQIAQQLLDSWEPLKQVSPTEKKIKDSPTRPPLPSLPPLEFKVVP